MGGQEWDSDEEEDVAGPEAAMITESMLMRALKETSKSVTAESYQKYIDMKERFDRETGQGAAAAGPSSVPTASSGASAPVPSAPANQPSLQEDEESDED